MANLKHLAELKKGRKSWNQWRRDNPHVVPNLKGADLNLVDLSLADLRGAQLSKAKFSDSRLFAADFSKADLSGSNLSKADLKLTNFNNSNLSKANLSGADLSESYLRRADLRESNLSKAKLNAATLSFTEMSEANLTKADLSMAVLSAANLQNANLNAVQALGTDLTGANLTGACLQDWNINSKTILRDVYCEYIYLKKGFGLEFSGRHPRGRNFQPGEFTKQFLIASETIELFFTNGFTEFFQSFQELQGRHPDKVLAIEEIEPKANDTLAIRLEVLPGFNEEATKGFYEEQLQLVKATYAYQASTQVIEAYKQLNAELIELAKLSAAKPINLSVEATAMSKSEGFTNNLQGANIANFANQMDDNSRQQAN